MTQKYVNDLAYKIIGCAIEVHKNLGPGYDEEVYKNCMLYELEKSGLRIEKNVSFPIKYKDISFEKSLLIDAVVENAIIVLARNYEKTLPLHKAQMHSFLKMIKLPKGLAINFNSDNVTSQLVSIVSEEFNKLPKE